MDARHSQRVIGRAFFLEVPDDVLKADVGANDAGKETNGENKDVLDAAEDEDAFGVTVPVGCCINLMGKNKE